MANGYSDDPEELIPRNRVPDDVFKIPEQETSKKILEQGTSALRAERRAEVDRLGTKGELQIYADNPLIAKRQREQAFKLPEAQIEEPFTPPKSDIELFMPNEPSSAGASLVPRQEPDVTRRPSLGSMQVPSDVDEFGQPKSLPPEQDPRNFGGLDDALDKLKGMQMSPLESAASGDMSLPEPLSQESYDAAQEAFDEMGMHIDTADAPSPQEFNKQKIDLLNAELNELMEAVDSGDINNFTPEQQQNIHNKIKLLHDAIIDLNMVDPERPRRPAVDIKDLDMELFTARKDLGALQDELANMLSGTEATGEEIDQYYAEIKSLEDEIEQMEVIKDDVSLDPRSVTNYQDFPETEGPPSRIPDIPREGAEKLISEVADANLESQLEQIRNTPVERSTPSKKMFPDARTETEIGFAFDELLNEKTRIENLAIESGQISARDWKFIQDAELEINDLLKRLPFDSPAAQEMWLRYQATGSDQPLPSPDRDDLTREHVRRQISDLERQRRNLLRDLDLRPNDLETQRLLRDIDYEILNEKRRLLRPEEANIDSEIFRLEDQIADATYEFNNASPEDIDDLRSEINSMQDELDEMRAQRAAEEISPEDIEIGDPEHKIDSSQFDMDEIFTETQQDSIARDLNRIAEKAEIEGGLAQADRFAIIDMIEEMQLGLEDIEDVALSRKHQEILDYAYDLQDKLVLPEDFDTRNNARAQRDLERMSEATGRPQQDIIDETNDAFRSMEMQRFLEDLKNQGKIDITDMTMGDLIEMQKAGVDLEDVDDFDFEVIDDPMQVIAESELDAIRNNRVTRTLDAAGKVIKPVARAAPHILGPVGAGFTTADYIEGVVGLNPQEFAQREIDTEAAIRAGINPRVDVMEYYSFLADRARARGEDPGSITRQLKSVGRGLKRAIADPLMDAGEFGFRSFIDPRPTPMQKPFIPRTVQNAATNRVFIPRDPRETGGQ
jgi:predicted  nucleic acid-binding Zn-ribbon protein